MHRTGVATQRHIIAGAVQLAHHLRRAQRRMAGKRHLVIRREDAEARSGAIGVVGKDEGDLGQIELAPDGLHGRIVQAPPVLEDGELIAAEGGFGEDVEQAEGVA